MEILTKIKSIYILDLLFDYIEDENFKYKLVVHSKYHQNLMNIKLIDYKMAYLDNSDAQLIDYLYNSNNILEDKFDKNIYEKKIEKDLKRIGKIDRKDLDELVLKYYEEIKDEKKNEGEYLYYEDDSLIDVFSPFFDIISKSKIFYQYTIPISINVIKKYNLKNEYVSIFKSKSNLKSLKIYYKDIDDLYYLKELKINFNNIKALSFCVNEENDVEEEEENDEEEEENGEEGKEDNTKISDFLKHFISVDNLGNNILKLNLNLPKKYNNLKQNILENINNFGTLKILELSGFGFKNKCEIKINDLKILILKNCENITLVGNNCLNMVVLYLIKSSISKSESSIKFPNLKMCVLDNQNFNSIIDFPSLEKLKYIECEKSDFIFLEKTSLEAVTLRSKINNSVEIEKKVIEKLINISTLKDIHLYLSEINYKQISEIKGENLSVTKLTVNWNVENIPSRFNELQNKFPNLLDFELFLPYFEDIWGDFDDNPPAIQITPQENSKITKFSLDIRRYNYFFGLYCAPLNKLEEISFTLITNIEDLRYALPIFDNKCKVIFESLIKFKITCGNNKNEINFEFIENIYNNIDCMPKLKYFSLDCMKTVKEDFYKNFIKKILSLKLDSIYFSILNRDFQRDSDPYSEKELKEIYPNLDYKKYESIFIQKFKAPKNLEQ